MSAARPTAALAAAGVLTGIAGVVTSQATAWALRAPNPPVSAVASAVRDLTPGDLAVDLVHLVGDLDKPLLLAGTLLILLGLCALIGVSSWRHPLLPDVAFLLLAGIGLAAVLRLEDSTIGSSMAVVVGLVTWIVVLRYLVAPLVPAATRTRANAPEDDQSTGPVVSGETRRTVLVRAAVVAGLVAAAGVAGRLASRNRRRVERARELLRLPGSRGAVPPAASVGIDGVEPWRTPNKDFYLIHTALAAPSITPGDWRLRVHGMVDRELEIDYRDLVARGFTEDWITLCCVSNEVGGDLIGNAWWSGVPVRDVLAEAGVHRDADAVLQTSHDGWTCGTPLAALTDDRNALLALRVNGVPLPIDHGFPVRMVVPGLYGYVSATKWLVDLEVTRFDRFDAYWTRRGWAEEGPVKTQSRIDVPGDGADVEAGRVRVGGSAWAQHTGIARVEVRLDGGPWQPARLGVVPNADTWVQWAAEVDVDPGDHELAVRATDRTGETQTAVRTDVVPDGATGWHTIGFTAR